MLWTTQFIKTYHISYLRILNKYLTRQEGCEEEGRPWSSKGERSKLREGLKATEADISLLLGSLGGGGRWVWWGSEEVGEGGRGGEWWSWGGLSFLCTILQVIDVGLTPGKLIFRVFLNFFLSKLKINFL